MCETSLRRVDHVLPITPYRHITFTFAGHLAVRLGYDKALLAKVMAALGSRLEQNMRRRLKAIHHLKSVEQLHTGSLSVVQHFRYDLELYLHVHSLVLDGAYFCDHADPCASVHPFYTLPDWSVHDLKRVISSLDADIQKLLDDANDDDAEHEGVRACLQIGTSHVNDTMDVRASPKAKPVSKGLLVSGEYVALHVAPAFHGRGPPTTRSSGQVHAPPTRRTRVYLSHRHG